MYTEITVRPMAGHIGAEIANIDLAQPLTENVIAEIRRALLKWKVVFFRRQSIGHTEHVAFTARFGDVTYAQPYEPETVAGFPQVLAVKWRRLESHHVLRRYHAALLWHTDLTPALNPPAAAILRAVKVPESAGDTHWTNLAAAYQGLSPPLRAFADGLKAEHRFNARGLARDGRSAYHQRVAANPYVSIHPVIRVHPETGERVHFINPAFTSHLLGVSARESDRLLDLFFEHLESPAYTVRFRWNAGDIAFWDNRATAHLAPQDLDDQDVERVMYRTMVVGDIPVGVDGFRSESVEGGLFGSEAPESLRKFLDPNLAMSSPRERPD